MPVETFWNNVKTQLRKQLPDHAFNTWFDPIQCIGVTDNELILEVPNQFFYEWIESHYKGIVQQALKSKNADSITVKYTVSPERLKRKEKKPAQGPSRPYGNRSIYLNKNLTFSAFIEGDNNRFARTAAFTVAESPGKQAFNPLIIYGGVGLGKTHLLHAIGNHVVEVLPRLNVVIASSEKFTLDFIASIQKNRTVEFSRSYRKADVLLIDDIQFFQKKEQTQEQFFHTFNELYQAGKQIVLTADRYPGEMHGLQDRLLSRFESGLAVDIQPPDFETRVAILMEKAEQNGLSLPYDIVEFMALHIKKNVRELESTIIRLLAHSSLIKTEIDFPLVRKVVRERVGTRLVSDLTMGDIIRRVAEVTKVSEREIVGNSRRMPIAEARQISMYLCREILGSSLVSIGTHFGGRDHTTILHACRKIEQKIKEEPRVEQMVGTLKKSLTISLRP